MSNGISLLSSGLLADAAAPVFLMSILKPVLTLAIFVPYGAIVAGKLVKDAHYYNLKPAKWSSIFLGFAFAAFAVAVLVPFWVAGFPVAVALLVAPIIWYVKYRNAATPDAKKLVLFNMDFDKMATERRARSARGSVLLRFQKKDRNEFPVPEQKDPGHVVYVALQELLMPLTERRIQRMELGLGKQGAAVTQTVDGVRLKANPLPAETATPLIDMMKGFSDLDPNERRKYQRGTLTVLRDDRKVTMTVTSMGSMQGETIRIDVEREKQLTIPLDKLGMLDVQLKLYKDNMAQGPSGGVVLVGARPGNGLTALGYSMIAAHDAFTKNIKTIERRPERQVEGVEHCTFDTSKADYSTQMQSIVRRGPDVVLVGEAGEAGVAKVAAAPNARSVLFYVLYNSDNPLDILTHWMKNAGDVGPASEAPRILIVSRLLRKLCSGCRVAYQPGPDVMKMLAIPAGKQVQLYRSSGKVLVKDQPTDCPTCGGTGYLGMTGAYEVLVFDEQSHALLKSGDVKGAYLQARRANRSLSLQEAALMKVRAGETSLEEVKRVFAAPAAASGAAPGSPAPAPAAAAAGGAPAAPVAPAKPPAA